jgi:PAS domain S-box-containing protein
VTTTIRDEGQAGTFRCKSPDRGDSSVDESNRAPVAAAVVAVTATIALLDFWTSANFIVSVLYTFPLALSAVHRFKRLLWGTAGAAAALTLAAEFWGFDRVALVDPVVASVNRGFVVASLLILTAFIHLLIDKGRHLEAMEGRYRGLLEAAPDVMVVVNQDREIVILNLQAERQFGYRRDELLGQKLTNIIPHGFAERLLADGLRSIEDAAAQRIGTGIELSGRRRDGSEFPIEIMLSPLEDANGILVTAAIRDITERKRNEVALQNRNAQLEVAVNELEAFSYSVSHDLRAPLRAIDGFSRILLKQYGSSLPEDGRDYLQLVHDNAVQMGHLVDDLLALSRLGRQPLSKQTVRTAAIIEHVLRNVRQPADRRFVGVSVGDMPDVCGDPSLLKQVFVNLIDNAFKYTRMRAEADIEIGSRQTNGEQVLFVRDNGVGFDMQYAGKLFGVFERMHRVDDFEGTGVGLAIVKRIVERHGGRVWAEAAVDRGATFYFTIEASRS